MRSIVSSALLLPFGLALFFILYILLARVLSPSEYGKLNFVISVSSFLAIMFGAGLPVATTKYIPKYLVEENYKLAAGYLAWGLLWTVAISTFLCVFLFALSYLEWIESIREYSLFFAITIPPIMLWQWQRYSSLGFDFVVTAITPRDIIYPSLALMGIYFFNISTVQEALYWLNGVYLISLVFGLVILFRKKPNFISFRNVDFSDRKGWHKTSFPMVISIIVQLGLNNWDLILLGILSSMEDAGLYAVATRIAMLVSLVIRVFDTAISQKIAKLFAARKYKELLSTFNIAKYISSIIGILVFSLVFYFHKNILLFFGEKYQDIVLTLMILCSGHLVLCLTGPVISTLNMIEKQSFVAKSLLRWSMISLIMNAVTIPFFSIYGAAFSFFFCTAGLRIEQHLKLRQTFKQYTKS